MNDRGVVRLRVSGNTGGPERHQSTLAVENLNYITTQHSYVNFEVHSIDITCVKN